MGLASAACVAAAVVVASTGQSAAVPVVVGHVTLQAPEPRCGKTGCVTPAPRLALRFRSAHHPLVTVKTGARGNFRVKLAPGVYTVSTVTTEESPEARLTPARIVVRRGRSAPIAFVYRPGSP